MTTLPKHHADDADWIAAVILAAVDQEPPEIRERLLEAMRAKEHQVGRYPDKVIAYFPTVDKISYELPIVPTPRRYNA